LTKIDKIDPANFQLSDEDVLRCRRKTTGMTKFECKPVKDGKEFSKSFTFIDVGGQRNERRKWLKSKKKKQILKLLAFQDNFQCLIFVSSLSEYNQKCYEDDVTNRMLESLDLFDEQINGEFFKDKPIILFLNKYDLFKIKIQEFPLKQTFSDYEGPEKDVDAAIEFIKKQFLAKNQFAPDRVHVYLTEAINIEKVQHSFNEILELSSMGRLKVE
jgi:GTPase SAR1 family protein